MRIEAKVELDGDVKRLKVDVICRKDRELVRRRKNWAGIWANGDGDSRTKARLPFGLQDDGSVH